MSIFGLKWVISTPPPGGIAYIHILAKCACSISINFAGRCLSTTLSNIAVNKYDIGIQRKIQVLLILYPAWCFMLYNMKPSLLTCRQLSFYIPCSTFLLFCSISQRLKLFILLFVVWYINRSSLAPYKPSECPKTTSTYT